MNPLYKVLFVERANPGSSLIAWLGDQPPTPQGGGGGYEVVTLPMRSAVTVWKGRSQPLMMDIPILLWDEELEPYGRRGLEMRATSTAGQVKRLMSMWRPADDTQAPPVIRVRCDGDAVPFTNLHYVVNDVTWGGAIGDDHANRVTQQLVVQVLEYRADEYLQTQRVARPGAGRTRHYTVKAGDTLISIARRFGLPNGWRELGRAQSPPINDPRAIRVGQRLLIPPVSTAAWGTQTAVG